MRTIHPPVLTSLLAVMTIVTAPSQALAQCKGDLTLGLGSDVWAALVGAFLAGLFSIGSGMLLHRREVKTRFNQWVREQLFEAYSNSFYYLIKLGLSSEAKSTSDKDVRQHFSEAQRFLNILRGYHANSVYVTRLQACTRALGANSSNTSGLSSAAESALEVVKEMFANDPRVQIPNRE